MTATAPKACPICGKAPADKFQPFCSARCADVDLGRWISESYTIPTNEDPEADQDNAAEGD